MHWITSNRLSNAFLLFSIQSCSIMYRRKGPKCLILTGTKKFFSAGVDLKYIDNDLSNKEGVFISKVLSKIMKRLLLFNMPTVAAINGLCMCIIDTVACVILNKDIRLVEDCSLQCVVIGD